MSQGKQTGRWAGLAAAAAVLACSGGAAHAGNLDKALLDETPKIIQHLHQEGIRNVGVLPFQVKRGTRPAGYSVSPLGASLPGRLENALILCQGNSEKRAIGIIRDAAGAASAQKVGAWSKSAAAFNSLFAKQYPLAWGGRKVRPDAFITGLVSSVGDRGTTTVEVHLIDRDSRDGGKLTPKKVATFRVKTDRPLLRDLGYSYALARSALRPGVTSRARDDLALQQVQEDEDDGPRPQPRPDRPETPDGAGDTAPNTPDNLAGMAFEIRYDGKKQPFRRLSGKAKGGRGSDWEVDPVKAGMKVEMLLTRLADDARTMGVVIKLNGKSLFAKEDDDSISCRKWLYDRSDKGKPNTFHGFYMGTEGKNLERFKVISGADAKARAAELGDKAGWIDIDVYASQGGAGGTTTQTPQSGDLEEVRHTTRGLARSLPSTRSFAEVQRQVARANRLKLKVNKHASSRDLIVNEAVADEEVKLDTGSLPNPVHLGGVSIRYWDRKASGPEIENE